CSHRRVLHILLIGVSGATDETTRVGLAELQNNVAGRLIGGIFLVPKDRYVEEVEHGGTDFLRDGIEEFTDYRVGGCNTRTRRFLWHIPLHFSQILIADRHGRA